MDFQSVLQIIFISIFALAIIVLVIYCICRSKKKKQYLKSNGEKFRKLIVLNKKYYFDPIKFDYTINHRLDSKRKLDKLSFRDLLLYFYDNNMYDIKDMFHAYVEQTNLYTNYEKEYEDILNEKIDYDAEILDKKLFKTVEDFINYEDNWVLKLKIKNKNRYEVSIHATYTSPQGRNHWYRDETFEADELKNFDDIIRRKYEYQYSKEYQRSLMTDSLRYDVLKRDHYRCQLCGALASEGAQLEVDHIIPVSKGGKTEMSNLQTLCKSCNRGKSDKYN